METVQLLLGHAELDHGRPTVLAGLAKKARRDVRRGSLTARLQGQTRVPHLQSQRYNLYDDIQLVSMDLRTTRL